MNCRSLSQNTTHFSVKRGLFALSGLTLAHHSSLLLSSRKVLDLENPWEPIYKSLSLFSSLKSLATTTLLTSEWVFYIFSHLHVLMIFPGCFFPFSPYPHFHSLKYLYILFCQTTRFRCIYKSILFLQIFAGEFVRSSCFSRMYF